MESLTSDLFKNLIQSGRPPTFSELYRGRLPESSLGLRTGHSPYIADFDTDSVVQYDLVSVRLNNSQIGEVALRALKTYTATKEFMACYHTGSFALDDYHISKPILFL